MRRNYSRRTLFLSFCYAGLALVTMLTEAEEISGVPEFSSCLQDNFDVAVTDGLVTVRVQNVSIKNVLETIADQSDLVLVLNDPLTESITMEMERLPFAEAIASILDGRNFALQHAQPASGTLWVFSDGTGQEFSSSEAVELQGNSILKDAFTEAVTSHTDDSITPSSAALNHDDKNIRLAAVDALGDTGSNNAVQALEQALLDSATEVREAAIEAFTEIGGVESARALVVALNDEDAELREDAVEALGEIGGLTAIRLLEKALGDPQIEIQEAAAEILSELSEQKQ